MHACPRISTHNISRTLPHESLLDSRHSNVYYYNNNCTCTEKRAGMSHTKRNFLLWVRGASWFIRRHCVYSSGRSGCSNVNKCPFSDSTKCTFNQQDTLQWHFGAQRKHCFATVAFLYKWIYWRKQLNCAKIYKIHPSLPKEVGIVEESKRRCAMMSSSRNISLLRNAMIEWLHDLRDNHF